MNDSLCPILDYDTDLKQNARTARAYMHFHPFVKLPPEESISESVKDVELANSMPKCSFPNFWIVHKAIFRK